MINRINKLRLILPNYITKIVIDDNSEMVLNLKKVDDLHNVIYVLKNSMLFNINSLIDLTTIDWLTEENRYEVLYNLYSYVYNYRLLLSVIPQKTIGMGHIIVESIINFFPGANWLEREVWDMFGVYFSNHLDLRRILTDYGFSGFPLRKDFPLSGFKEIRYDDVFKVIVFENLKLSQEFRDFSSTNNPWLTKN